MSGKQVFIELPVYLSDSGAFNTGEKREKERVLM